MISAEGDKATNVGQLAKGVVELSMSNPIYLNALLLTLEPLLVLDTLERVKVEFPHNFRAVMLCTDPITIESLTTSWERLEEKSIEGAKRMEAFYDAIFHSFSSAEEVEQIKRHLLKAKKALARNAFMRSMETLLPTDEGD